MVHDFVSFSDHKIIPVHFVVIISRSNISVPTLLWAYMIAVPCKIILKYSQEEE